MTGYHIFTWHVLFIFHDQVSNHVTCKSIYYVIILRRLIYISSKCIALQQGENDAFFVTEFLYEQIYYMLLWKLPIPVFGIVFHCAEIKYFGFHIVVPSYYLFTKIINFVIRPLEHCLHFMSVIAWFLLVVWCLLEPGYTWWRHQMETFSSSLVICEGNSPHKGQWRGALMFSLICAWING